MRRYSAKATLLRCATSALVGMGAGAPRAHGMDFTSAAVPVAAEAIAESQGIASAVPSASPVWVEDTRLAYSPVQSSPLKNTLSGGLAKLGLLGDSAEVFKLDLATIPAPGGAVEGLTFEYSFAFKPGYGMDGNPLLRLDLATDLGANFTAGLRLNLPLEGR